MLLDADQTNILDFHESVAPFDSKRPNQLRFDVTPEALKSFYDNQMDMLKKNVDAVVNVPGPRTFWNTFGPSIRENELDRFCGGYNILEYVSPNKEVRDIITECSKEISAFYADLQARVDVFEAQKAFAATEEYNTLDSEKKRLVDFTLRDARRRGLDLEESKREKILELQKEISKLSIDFSKNLTEDLSKIILSKEELTGVSESQLSKYKRVREDGSDATDEDLNDAEKQKALKYVVTMKYPDYIPAMEQCSVEETRKKLYTCSNSRCQDSNSEILDKIIKLRAERAEILGYATHADWVLETRMAKNPQTVEDFLTDLNARLTPVFRSELADLENIKRDFAVKAGIAQNDEESSVKPWDRSFLTAVYEKENFNLDQEKLAEFFPLDKVRKGLFEIYEKILGLKFIKVDPKSEEMPEISLESSLWHEDAELFQVKDAATDEDVGQFYVDLFPREGKYGHACVAGIAPGFELTPFKFTNCKNETTAATEATPPSRQLPICILICNFPRPTGEGEEKQPALLPHKDVVTFFHEFGHAMHQLCTEVKVPRFAGTSVERDLVEAPSQMLENWCYEPESLNLMSGHYKTDEAIPAETLAVLQKIKSSFAGCFNKRQMCFALVDQRIYTKTPKDFATGETNCKDEYASVLQEVMEWTDPEGTNFMATFGHVAGGYDAAYYGYLWSEVYAADMFMSMFKESEGGILDTTVGMQYRKKILAVGGTKDGMEIISDFLGREPNNKAFLKLKGLEVEMNKKCGFFACC